MAGRTRLHLVGEWGLGLRRAREHDGHPDANGHIFKIHGVAPLTLSDVTKIYPMRLVFGGPPLAQTLAQPYI